MSLLWIENRRRRGGVELKAIFVEQCTDRLAVWVWRWMDGEYDAVIGWLRAMGCTVTRAGEDWMVRGSTGVMTGLMPTQNHLDPVSTAIQFGFILAGELWPFAFPGLLEKVNQEWKRRRRKRG
jgi:hypothetical protein